MRLLIATLTLLLALARTTFAADSPPNIVIILTDDQGYADVGCFGATGFDTPNLDRMAAEGRRFTNFHVAQAVCSASRAALLTGCYSNRIGIHGALGPNARHGISASEITIAQMLKPQGYATAIVGKWHLGHLPPFLPLRHGFDEWLGLPYSNDMWPPNHQGNANYPSLPLYDGDQVINPNVTDEVQSRLTTMYTERAVSFIQRNKNHPFFLYIAHNMPHVPLNVSDKFKGKSKQGLYGDVIEEIDWSVGQVLVALKQNDLDDRTLVIFTSDNGPWLVYGNHAGSAGPLREGKGTSWEGGTREPCIMRWPGHLPAGTTCSDMLMTIDLLPSLARLTGAEMPKNKIDGLDVWPLIIGDPGAKNPHEAYFTYYEVGQLQAVTDPTGHWQLQLPHTYRSLNGHPPGHDGIPGKYENIKLERRELYDLTMDISQRRDVSADHPEVAQRLTALAEQCREDLGDALTKRRGSGVRPAETVPAAPAPTGAQSSFNPDVD
jgi:arylsulfatase